MGQKLIYSLNYTFHEEDFRKSIKETLGSNAEKFLNILPSFYEGYQSWCSESKVLVRQLLFDRLDDFVSHYEISKYRNELILDNYRIFDFLAGIDVDYENIIIYHFKQQLEIVKSIRKRFESSLFDIVQIVQADLFDSELDSARALVESGFLRAGGAMAGVVMERHLAQVCKNHKITIRRKDPTISYLNDKLKNEGVIDTPKWRLNQRLGDIRNLCAHDKDKEPSINQVTELIDGVAKLTKTIL